MPISSQKALILKEEGNKLFAEHKFKEAIDMYSKALEVCLLSWIWHTHAQVTKDPIQNIGVLSDSWVRKFQNKPGKISSQEELDTCILIHHTMVRSSVNYLTNKLGWPLEWQKTPPKVLNLTLQGLYARVSCNFDHWSGPHRAKNGHTRGWKCILTATKVCIPMQTRVDASCAFTSTCVHGLA